MQALQQMLILFLLMATGYLCYKINIISEDGTKSLNSLVVNVGNPAMILVACTGDSVVNKHDLLVMAPLIIGIYTALILISMIIPKILRVEKKKAGTYQVMTIFANIGFMGYPIIAALYGKGAVLLASLFGIPYNILIYSFGVALMSQSEDSSLKDMLSFKKIVNVGFVTSMFTLAVVIFELHVPDIIAETVTHLGNMAVPVSMIVIGTSLAKMNLLDLFTDKKLILFSAIRLLLVPLLFVTVIRQFIDNPLILGICMIQLSTPVGSMVALLAKEYDGDAMLAAKGVTLSTVLSVITIPIVATITGL